LLTQRASAVNPLRCCCCCARVIQLAAEISIVGAKVLRGDRRRERERERERGSTLSSRQRLPAQRVRWPRESLYALHLALPPGRDISLVDISVERRERGGDISVRAIPRGTGHGSMGLSVPSSRSGGESCRIFRASSRYSASLFRATKDGYEFVVLGRAIAQRARYDTSAAYSGWFVWRQADSFRLLLNLTSHKHEPRRKR